MTSLRLLTKEDIGSFRRVRLLGLHESPTAFGASYAQEEKLPLEELAKRLEGTADRWVIGAFSEQDLIGVIGFIREAGDKSRHKGFIWGMYVVPAFRGKGIGRALFKEALSRIDALPGLRKVSLAVVTSNLQALRLYEKFGFVRYGEEIEALCVDGIFHSEFHMVRRTKQDMDSSAALTAPTPARG
jgi:ribosomal protein S18 acetylase RimI-like enzyme